MPYEETVSNLNAYSALCMNTNGSAISLQAQDPNENSRLDQLWYISYVAGHDRYAIRPISDFSLAMDVDVGNYVTVDPNEVGAYWDIVAYSFGFTIRYYGNSNENAKPVVADAPGSQIYLGSDTSLRLGLTGTSGYLGEVYCRDALVRFLDDGHILCIYRVYYSGQSLQEQKYGHYMIICGYVLVNGEYRFLVKDPGPPNVGSCYLISYEKLYFGAHNQWDEKGDNYAWYAVVVHQTTYSGNKMPWFMEQGGDIWW